MKLQNRKSEKMTRKKNEQNKDVELLNSSQVHTLTTDTHIFYTVRTPRTRTADTHNDNITRATI